MAQIMGYHRWPTKGIGSNTYTTKTKKINVSADFSQSTYDWNNITPTYNESSTTAQKDAIALLMRDCGITSFMDYASDGSGAYFKDAAKAFMNNFGYDENLQLYDRQLFTSAEWMDMIKEDINKDLPVYYGGQSSGGGHAFVCDGYDTNNLFHINWGWGGMSNGYFELNMLNPGTQGIGGGLGGFNFYQLIFKGIQKPTSTSKPSYLISQTNSMTTTATTIYKDTQFTVYYGVRNQGINAISPYFGLALYNNDTFVNILRYTSFKGPLEYGYGNDNMSLKLTINSSVANGNYQLRPVYSMDKAASWTQMRSVVGIVNYLNVTVTNDNITISKPDGIGAKVSVTNPFKIVGNLYQQENGRFKVSLKNTSKVEFCAPIFVFIQADGTSTKEKLVTEGITLQPDETIDMNLTSPLNYTPENYLIHLVAEGNNETQDLATIEAKILPPPTEPYQLRITQALTSTKTSIYSDEGMNLTAKIKNEGGYYDGVVYGAIYNTNDSNTVKMFSDHKLILDKNEETTINFNDYLELLPGEYYTRIYAYDYNGRRWFYLTPTDLNKYTFTVTEGSGIDSPNYSALSIYPNPATNKLNVRADDNVKFIRITDLTGKTMLTLSPSQKEKEISISIDELNAGTYLLQITTDNGIRTNKFVKQN